MLDGILLYHICMACLMVAMATNEECWEDVRSNRWASIFRITYILKKLLSDRPFEHLQIVWYDEEALN